MALNAFMKIGSAGGEARQGKYKTNGWIEIQSWDWEVEAESSWTKGGGASVGKPNPGKFNFEHYYDKSSPVILKFISSGEAFPEILLEMCKGTGELNPKPFFQAKMTEAFITKVSNSATEEGNVTQKVELAFKTIHILYKPQNDVGGLDSPVSYNWDVAAGTVG